MSWTEKSITPKTWIEKILPSPYYIFTTLHQHICSNDGSLIVTHYTIWEEHPNINQPWIEKGG